jgi:hypothetical protein
MDQHPLRQRRRRRDRPIAFLPSHSVDIKKEPKQFASVRMVSAFFYSISGSACRIQAITAKA